VSSRRLRALRAIWRKLVRSLAVRGVAGTGLRGAQWFYEKLQHWVTGQSAYEVWLERTRQASRVSSFQAVHEWPRLSILVPTWNAKGAWLERALASVIRQGYPHWELEVVDDASEVACGRAVAREWSQRDRRIRLHILEARRGISGATNVALANANGDWIGLLDHDDELSPDSLAVVAKALDEHSPDLLYTDEDKIGLGGQCFDPAFKPDFSMDWLRSCNYISHLGVYRTSLVRRLGGFRAEFDGSQDYDLALRVAEATTRIVHVPRILYHWRSVPGSTADAFSDGKPWAYEAARSALREHLVRCGIDARVEDGPGLGLYHVSWSLPKDCRVTLIVLGDARQARSLQEKAGFDIWQSLVVSKRGRGPVASRLQQAAAEATGHVLLFVDGRLDPAPGALRELAAHAARPEVGAVGARIVGPRGALVHAGQVTVDPGVIRTSRPALHAGEPGPLGAARVIREATAVAGSVLATSREVLEKLKGFDEGYARSLYETDFCLRARSAGLRVLFLGSSAFKAPTSRWMRHSEDDLERLRQSWEGRAPVPDPYYNPGLSQTGPLYEYEFRRQPRFRWRRHRDVA